jgi:hypothetical protein
MELREKGFWVWIGFIWLRWGHVTGFYEQVNELFVP